MRSLSQYIGLLPKCSSFLLDRYLLHLKPEKPVKNKITEKYVLQSCGKTNLCFDCATNYISRKAAKWKSLADALSMRFPKIEFAELCFTIPHDHEWHIDENQDNYDRFFKIAFKVLREQFGEIGAILNLQNFSSENPNNKHIHIHALVFLVRFEKFKPLLIKGYIPDKELDSLKLRFKELIGYESKKQIDLKYVYYKASCKDWSEHGFFRFRDKKVEYALRTPIVDLYYYCLENNLPFKLNKEFLDRVAHIKGIQHYRFYGWMSNFKKGKYLSTLGIVELQVGEKYRLIGRDRILYEEDDHYVLECFGIVRKCNVSKPNSIGTYKKFDYIFASKTDNC